MYFFYYLLLVKLYCGDVYQYLIVLVNIIWENKFDTAQVQ